MKSAPTVVVLLSAALSGCVHAKAKAMTDAPALDVPVPPARVVETIETEAPPPATLPEEPRRNPVRPRPTPPAASAGQPARPAAPASDMPVAPDTPPVVAEEPKPATPAPTLQTTPAAQEGEVERGIRATLSRAAASLNRIDYRALNAEARTQYDTAKRFIQQAEDAMKAKNLMFAKSLADKAATLAAQLGGR
jgi:hypothetical protein